MTITCFQKTIHREEQLRAHHCYCFWTQYLLLFTKEDNLNEDSKAIITPNCIGSNFPCANAKNKYCICNNDTQDILLTARLFCYRHELMTQTVFKYPLRNVQLQQRTIRVLPIAN